MSTHYYSNGKLLITGEYVVLDGALSLAVPTKFGQSLEVTPGKDQKISWRSLDHNNKEWIKALLIIENGTIQLVNEQSIAENKEHTLQKILQEAYNLNTKIFRKGGFTVTSRLDFSTTWGLGSSSTLINNIAQWFEIDPYLLLEKTFGGSGYDIATAQHNTPITYQHLGENKSVLQVGFDPVFKDQLFFVHLNQKQNSRASIAHYKNQPAQFLEETIEKISSLTQSILKCTSLAEFNMLLEIHETLISKLIKTPKVKTRLFQDYPGAIKSLGGWGGDFVLATGGEQEKKYFKKKGYETILTWSQMLLP